MLAPADGRPALALGRRRRREGGIEPGPGGRGKISERRGGHATRVRRAGRLGVTDDVSRNPGLLAKVCTWEAMGRSTPPLSAGPPPIFSRTRPPLSAGWVASHRPGRGARRAGHASGLSGGSVTAWRSCTGSNAPSCVTRSCWSPSRGGTTPVTPPAWPCATWPRPGAPGASRPSTPRSSTTSPPPDPRCGWWTASAATSSGPPIELWAASVPGTGRDVVLLRGVEPQLSGGHSATPILGVAETLRVELAVTARRAAGRRAPHPAGPGHRHRPTTSTWPPASASSGPGTRGRPGSSACSTTPAPAPACRRRRCGPSVPHYVHQVPSPKAALALVERSAALLGARVNPVELRVAADTYVRRGERAGWPTTRTPPPTSPSWRRPTTSSSETDDSRRAAAERRLVGRRGGALPPRPSPG